MTKQCINLIIHYMLDAMRQVFVGEILQYIVAIHCVMPSLHVK